MTCDKMLKYIDIVSKSLYPGYNNSIIYVHDSY